MFELVRLLNEMPLAGFMLVVTLGYAIGRVSWRGIALGPAGGTLGVAILFGAFGMDFRSLYGTDAPRFTIGALGFALFIYSVGFEAGPRFFSALRGGRGWRYVVVGLVVNVVALGLALALGRLLALGAAPTAGLLAGALTSAATYAAALEVGHASSDVAGALAVSFALVYPLGLVGIVLLIQLVPRLGGRDLVQQAEAEEEQAALAARRAARPELVRAFEVTEEEATGHPLRVLDLTHRTGCYVIQVHRGEAILAANAETVLELGDHVLVQGRLDELKRFAALVGPEVYDEVLRHRMPAPRRVVVQAPGMVGRTIGELELGRRHGCLVIGIERGHVHLEPAAEVQLERGDVLEVVGRRGDVRTVASRLGRLERPTHETNIGVYAGGVFLGVLIGRLSVRLLGLDLSLGVAGGLLLSGIVLGRFRRVGPFPTHVPRSARQLVRDFGILLFIAEAGVRAGGSSLVGLEGLLWPIVASGLAVSLVPVLVALFVACRLLRMRPIEAWGSVSGGMTSSAALATLQRATDSNAPAVSYAAAYAVASVFVTIAGRLVMLV